MIHVMPQPEPPSFNAKVRRRGQAFLASNPNPTSKQFQKKSFWKAAAEDIYVAYGGICAYTCFYFLKPASIDHFVPKSRRPDLAYEWNNYRLCKPRVNSHKGNNLEIVDPFVVQTGWFVLDFPSCLVRPNDGLPSSIADQISKTICNLKLNDDDVFVQERCDIMVDFAEGNIQLEFLMRRYPLLAHEIKRQGIETTASLLFKRRNA